MAAQPQYSREQLPAVLAQVQAFSADDNFTVDSFIKQMDSVMAEANIPNNVVPLIVYNHLLRGTALKWRRTREARGDTEKWPNLDIWNKVNHVPAAEGVAEVPERDGGLKAALKKAFDVPKSRKALAADLEKVRHQPTGQRFQPWSIAVEAALWEVFQMDLHENLKADGQKAMTDVMFSTRFKEHLWAGMAPIYLKHLDAKESEMTSPEDVVKAAVKLERESRLFQIEWNKISHGQHQESRQAASASTSSSNSASASAASTGSKNSKAKKPVDDEEDFERDPDPKKDAIYSNEDQCDSCGMMNTHNAYRCKTRRRLGLELGQKVPGYPLKTFKQKKAEKKAKESGANAKSTSAVSQKQSDKASSNGQESNNANSASQAVSGVSTAIVPRFPNLPPGSSPGFMLQDGCHWVPVLENGEIGRPVLISPQTQFNPHTPPPDMLDPYAAGGRY